MSRVAFKQCDAQRLFRAARKEGLSVAIRVDHKTGDLIAEPVDLKPSRKKVAPNPWDSLFAED